MRCGVVGAEADHQREWFDTTMAYFADRYPELNQLELAQLRTQGERFCAAAQVGEAGWLTNGRESARFCFPCSSAGALVRPRAPDRHSESHAATEP